MIVNCTSICIWARNSDEKFSWGVKTTQTVKIIEHVTLHTYQILDPFSLLRFSHPFCLLLLLLLHFHQINWHTHMSVWYEKWITWSENSEILEIATKILFVQAKSSWLAGRRTALTLSGSFSLYLCELARAYVSDDICNESSKQRRNKCNRREEVKNMFKCQYGPVFVSLHKIKIMVFSE